MKLLLVENHAVFVKTVSESLLASHEVTTVPSIAAAKAALRDWRAYDAALVDFDLDDGKGDELVHWMRELGLGTPVIGISAHAAGNKAILRAGALATCPKLRFSESGDVLDRVVSGSEPSEPYPNSV